MAYSAWAAKGGGYRSEGCKARSQQRLAAASAIADPFRRLDYNSGSAWAFKNYKPSVLALVDACRETGRQDGGQVRALEIGGGRTPLLTASEAQAAGVVCTVNDISERELALSAPEFAKAHFDIAGEVDPSHYGRYDLVFSKHVMEHVRDGRRAWENVARLLAPGGVALAFNPTLYSPVFVLNLVLPESLSGPLLRLFTPHRHDGEFPKFPAYYDLCRAKASLVEPALKNAGFREVLCVPFWGDIPYFRNVPGLREVSDAFSALAEAQDWRLVADYAYTVVRK